MRITEFNPQPMIEIPFLNACKGQGSYYVDRLPVHLVRVASLPDGLDTIIATADLQGRERFQDGIGGPPRLLGEVLPQRLVNKILPDLGIAADRTGVILAGDFYTVPGLDQRGGSGDVTEVWRAFASEFKWIAGVAGNHDMFGDSLAPKTKVASNAHYLDGNTVHVDGIKVGGIGGIVGNPRKPHRKTDDEFVQQIENLGAKCPDMLIMHDGPNGDDQRQRGSSIIRQSLEAISRTLLIRGHAHWSMPLVELSNSTQVLNVDCRVAILMGS